MVGRHKGLFQSVREPIAVSEIQLGMFGGVNELASTDGKQSSGDGAGCECSSCRRQSN